MAQETGPALKNICLCGFMCSGKTSAGRALARLLKRPFADTDALAGDGGPAAVIRRRGLGAFRALELAALRRAAAGGGKVIALGGGLYPAGKKGRILSRGCVTVFLSCPWGELERRLRRNRRGRPLLGGSWPQAAARARSLLARRLPYYGRADLTVETGGFSPAGTAAEIRRALRKAGCL